MNKSLLNNTFYGTWEKFFSGQFGKLNFAKSCFKVYCSSSLGVPLCGIHSLIFSFINSATSHLIHSPFILPLAHPLSYYPCIPPFTYSYIHPLIYLPVHPCLRSSIHPLCSSIHPFTYLIQ